MVTQRKEVTQLTSREVVAATMAEDRWHEEEQDEGLVEKLMDP